MPVVTGLQFRRALLAFGLASWASLAAGQAVREIVVTTDLVLPKDTELQARLIVRASDITINGNGAALVGPGKIGDTNSLESAGVGVLVEGATGLVLTNL